MNRILFQINIISLCIGLWACSQSTITAEVLYVSPDSEIVHTRTLTVEPSPSPFIPSRTPTILVSYTPSPSPTPTPHACWVQGGRFELSNLPSDLLPLPMEYLVYLPPCYDQLLERRFPVLYLIHGQNYNNDQWDRLGADEVADALISSGEVSPFIMVFPRDRSWAQPTEDRFGDVLVSSLIPYIDEKYRTKPERTYRAVGGLSRGAGWAVHLGLLEWEAFGAIGAHSLPVFWTDTKHIREWLDAVPQVSMPRIYMDIGEKDRPNIFQSARWFENMLTEKGIPHEWHLFNGYHEEAYWEAHVEQYLRWYAEGWEIDR